MCAMCTTPPVSSASEMSRSAMIDSASPGMPRRPSADAWKPSCATPSPLSVCSSQCSITGMSNMLRVLERAPHQQRRRHRPAIVGQRDAAGLLQLGDVGELLAFLAARHGANRIHAREVGLGGLLQDVVGDAGVVVHRRRVRHARDGGEAAGDRRGGAGRHRFLVLLPRLAQVHVHVDQPRARRPARSESSTTCVSRVGRQIPADARDAIAVDQHVEHAVAAVRRIDDAPAFKQRLGIGSRPPVRLTSTPLRISFSF